MTNILFLGGTAHGQMRSVDERYTAIRVPVRQGPPCYTLDYNCHPIERVKFDHYVLKMILVEGMRRVPVFALESLSDEELGDVCHHFSSFLEL